MMYQGRCGAQGIVAVRRSHEGGRFDVIVDCETFDDVQSCILDRETSCMEPHGAWHETRTCFSIPMDTCNGIAPKVILVFDTFDELWSFLPCKRRVVLTIGGLRIRDDNCPGWVEQEVVQRVTVSWRPSGRVDVSVGLVCTRGFSALP